MPLPLRSFIAALALIVMAVIAGAPPFVHASPYTVETPRPPAAEQQIHADPTTGNTHPPMVLRAFDKPAQNWLPGHRGVDLELGIGEPVRASAPGIIAFAGSVAGTPTISIDHVSGVRTTYQPVHARVSEGDAVLGAQIIGALGHPFDGWPGLHWGARVGEDYINPLSLLALPIIRLKPVDELAEMHRGDVAS